MDKMNMTITVKDLDEVTEFLQLCIDHMDALPEPVLAGLTKLAGYEPYQQRVIGEKFQLDNRIEKLVEYLKTASRDSDEFARLTYQLNAMRGYSEILQQRIDAW